METLIREVNLTPEILPSVIRSINEPEEEESGIFSMVGLKVGEWADHYANRYAEYKLTTGYWNLFRI